MPMTYRQAEDFIEIVKKGGKVFHFQFTLVGNDADMLTATRTKEASKGVIGTVTREDNVFRFQGRKFKRKHLKALKYLFREHFGQRFKVEAQIDEEDGLYDDDDDDAAATPAAGPPPEEPYVKALFKLQDQVPAALMDNTLRNAFDKARAEIARGPFNERRAKEITAKLRDHVFALRQKAEREGAAAAASAAPDAAAAEARKLNDAWDRQFERGYDDKADALREMFLGRKVPPAAISRMEGTRARFRSAISDGDLKAAKSELASWAQYLKLLDA